MKRSTNKKTTRKGIKAHWTLTSPSGVYLGSGTAGSAPEARTDALTKLAALGRRNGNVKVSHYSAAAQKIANLYR